ncbi:hypothetical protein [Streptomyces sp. NPDC008150]|uniref:hypothetical protein n=1 Tax=Streptomyces sp. NPDC008150 TaxID=3364816 RepID=UPI0036E7E7F4
MTSQAVETLRSRYAAQVASDLDENHRLQKELAERIRVLEQEEALLVNILKLAEEDGNPAEVPPATKSGSGAPLPAQAAVPAVAPAKTGSTSASRPKTATKSSPKSSPKPAAKSASKEPRSQRQASATAPPPVVAEKPGTPGTTVKPAKSAKSAKAAKETPRQPLLGALLLDLLAAHNEPRLAKELRDELMEKLPERKPTPQVVRNTLESLVAKGRIRRHKQQRSVMYTVIETAKGSADPVTAGGSGQETGTGEAG